METQTLSESPKLTKKDFKSDVDVKWCPGCGDYSILSAIQSVLAKSGKKKEDVVIVSGIGCSSRLPYYVDTYGMHTIHGRAPAFASGIKLSNPKLDVWMITGDGDGLSIGASHLMHLIRRNININVVLFNNEIYGLTKGQYSPTSRRGLVSKSSPMGSLDTPFSLAQLALGAGAGFFARTADNNIRHLEATLTRASQYAGTSIVEVLQNCVIFNNKVHDPYVGRENRDDQTVVLSQGEPLIFGKEKNKGIALDGLTPKVVDDVSDPSSLLIHDETNKSPVYAQVLASMNHPEFPVPLGVIKSVERSTYESQFHQQLDQARSRVQAKASGKLFKDFIYADSWQVS